MISLNALAATERNTDMLRAAEARRVSADIPARAGVAETDQATLALRLACADEHDLVRGLAQLDDAPDLEAPVLLAIVDGEAVAALSLHDRRVVANPFRSTEEPVAFLRLRAKQLSKTRIRRRRLRAILRPRLA